MCSLIKILLAIYLYGHVIYLELLCINNEDNYHSTSTCAETGYLSWCSDTRLPIGRPKESWLDSQHGQLVLPSKPPDQLWGPTSLPFN